MATTSDGPAEKTSDTPEVTIDGNVDVPVQPDSVADAISGEIADINKDSEHGEIHDGMESNSREEVAALLGGSEISGHEAPKAETDQDAAELAENVNSEEKMDTTVFSTDSILDLPDNQPIPDIIVAPVSTVVNHSVSGTDLNNLLKSQQDSLAIIQYISSKTDSVLNDTDHLKEQVNNISGSCELLTEEMKSFISSAGTKSILSKTYLTGSSVALALLVIFQMYLFFSLVKIQRLQNTAGSAVLENISGLNKKMADYNTNLKKVLEGPAHQEPGHPTPAAAEKAGHETHGNKEGDSAHITPVLEKLNKLRNGLPEKKLIRKETGDWFVLHMKSEEVISDVEVIDVLNQAYKRIGRSLSPKIPPPPHNALCILKPDGKGGTEVVMTTLFLP
ncbi:MAG: hypothetical protein WCP20_09530 [Desulfuromonadales bacterium]